MASMPVELEAILFRLHNRVSRWASAFFDLPARRFIEAVLTVLVVLAFATFFYLHAYYIGFAENECLTNRLSGAVSSVGGIDNLHLLRVRIVTEHVKAADRLRSLLYSEANCLYATHGHYNDSSLHEYYIASSAGLLNNSGHATRALWACNPWSADTVHQKDAHSTAEYCTSPSQNGKQYTTEGTTCVNGSAGTAHASILRALGRYLVSKAAPATIASRDIIETTLQQVIASLRLLLVEAEARDGAGSASHGPSGDENRESQSRVVLAAAKQFILSIFSSDGFTDTFIPEPLAHSLHAAKASVAQVLASLGEAAFAHGQGGREGGEKGQGTGEQQPTARQQQTTHQSQHPVTAVSAKLISLYTSILQALVLRNSELEMMSNTLASRHRGDWAADPTQHAPVAANASYTWRIHAVVDKAMQLVSADPVLLVMMTSLLGVQVDKAGLELPAEPSSLSPLAPALSAQLEHLHPLTTVPAAFKPSAQPSFLFAADKGMLSLTPEKRDQLMVGLVQLDVDASERCIGRPLSRWLLRHLVGYDTAVVNAIIHAVGGKGFVLAEHSGEILSLGHATEVHSFSDDYLSMILFKIGTFCSAVFLLFASSSLVSFILAQTQQRMLKFTVSLQQHVRARLPLLPLVASHLIDSLVFVPIMLGVLFFLFEFFSDQLLAFLVLLVVWICELWSITSIRTIGSLRVFPRVFGMFLTWFHVYYLAYPFGFQYMALGSASLAILCTIFHLWNRYELPALLDGRVTAQRPRVPEVAAIMNVHVVDPVLRDAATATPPVAEAGPIQALPPATENWQVFEEVDRPSTPVAQLPEPSSPLDEEIVEEAANSNRGVDMLTAPRTPPNTEAPKDPSEALMRTPPRAAAANATASGSPIAERLAPLVSYIGGMLSPREHRPDSPSSARTGANSLEAWAGDSPRNSSRSAWT